MTYSSVFPTLFLIATTILKNHLNDLVEKEIIAEVDEPTEWVNSLVLVHKPNGEFRICMDPQQLNKAIISEEFPLPTVDETISSLSHAKFFSKLDGGQAFWQIKLNEESSFKCTFNSSFGKYRFLRMPYGIKSASEVFQKYIKQKFDNMEGVLSYIDDFLIWGSTRDEHDIQLKMALKRCREINLKLNLEKCEFGVEKLKFIGHIISKDGVEPDEDKIYAIKSFKKPECKKDVERFLGYLHFKIRT